MLRFGQSVLASLQLLHDGLDRSTLPPLSLFEGPPDRLDVGLELRRRLSLLYDWAFTNLRRLFESVLSGTDLSAFQRAASSEPSLVSPAGH